MKSLIPIPRADREEALAIVRRLYDIGDSEAKCYYGPDTPFTIWNATTYSNERRSVIILHGRFRRKPRTLLASRAEILAHEFVHAFRAPYAAVPWEEYLAYRTSRSRILRLFGSFFRNAWLPWLLLVAPFIAIPLEAGMRLRIRRMIRTFRANGAQNPWAELLRSGLRNGTRSRTCASKVRSP